MSVYDRWFSLEFFETFNSWLFYGWKKLVFRVCSASVLDLEIIPPCHQQAFVAQFYEDILLQLKNVRYFSVLWLLIMLSLGRRLWASSICSVCLIWRVNYQVMLFLFDYFQWSPFSWSFWRKASLRLYANPRKVGRASGEILKGPTNSSWIILTFVSWMDIFKIIVEVFGAYFSSVVYLFAASIRP